MTLEEIYRRMKQNNQYYEGSQAQKEEQAGMTVQGDNVNHTQESANINKKYSNNRIGYIDTGSRTKNAFIQIGRDAKKAGSNLMIGAKRGANQLWNYIASQEINQQKKMAESMRKAFENNNIPIEEDNPIWKSATDEKLQEKYIGNIENKISKYDKQIQKNIEETGTKVSEKITELAPSIGNMIPGTIASMANPALGAGYFTTSAGGSYLTDARNKGATEEDALKYATALGVAEGATEMVGVGNLLKGGKELGKGAIKEALKSYGVNIADNFIQEAMMEPIQEATSELILGESDWNNIGQRMVSSGIDGALTALIMDGASSGISSSVNLVNKVRNKETITQNDINIAKQDLNTVTNKITELENKTKINNINNTKEIWKKPSTLTNDQVLSSTSKTKGSDISSTNSIISKNQIKSTQVQIAPLNEQTQIKYDSKNFAKQVDEVKNGVFPKNNTLVLLKNNKELPMQSYQYEKSENTKINALRQDANKYFNNTEQSHNFVNMLEKIITDKNVEIKFDANLKTPDGRVANGSYSDGVITINPNSTRTGEFIAIHELTHAIGTKDMLDMVNRYRESNAEFNSAVENLLQSYNTTELTEEALSDVSAQLFGNQEFINNLSQTNPNLFKRIYNEIKYLWHQFRGYKNQDQFIDDLKYKWEQAYKNNDTLNKTTNYYIETVADFNEMEYNNSKEIRLPKQEYAILSGIVNSDSNIKPGINYVETTNATYEVYYKETGEFKVLGKEVSEDYYDTITNGNIQGTGNTRYAESRMQVYSPTVQQSGTGTRNDEISDFNKRRTRISDTSIKNGTSNSNNVKYSIQESEDNLNIKDSNKSSFSFEKINSKITTDSNINKLTDKGITMTYVHMNNQNTQYYGTQYGQNIEPSGEYINVDTMQGKYKVPGAEYGTISFKNPLVLDHINTGETGWKKTLSDMFDGKTGKKLSKAIKDAGYDGIITIDEDGNYSEIVNINGKKIDNQESENNSDSFFNSEDFKKYILPEIKERYQYENKNKITETIEELKKRKETLDIGTDEGWDNNFIINQKIKALENGYDTIYDYLIEHDINELKKDYKYNPKILTDKINRVKQTEKKQEKLQKEIEEATPIKRAQYEIIQKTNPMFDDEHVGIRSPADIKTFEEAIQDDESFSWGDYTKEDAERDLKRNKVKIYSSYAIKNGVFVSTSYQQALDYAGGDRAQVHSKEIPPNRVAWINGDEGQYASINAKYFIENQTWQSYLDKNYKATGTRTNLQDIKLPTKEWIENRQKLRKSQNNIPIAKEYINKNTLNPLQISNLTENDVTTTPKLPDIKYKTDKGNNSKFYNNLMNKTGMLNDDVRNLIKNENDIKYYEGVTNVQSLREANERLQKGGSNETLRWFSKDLSDKNATVSATEVAEGWILLKQYQDAGDYESAVKVAKRMRDMATKSGQALQAYSIQARLTPEGMFQYAQSKLKEAFEIFSKNKTQEWINKHKQDFDLKPEETQAIIEKVKEAQQLDNNSYEKKVKLAEINKIITDKLPPERGASIKAWMRISMLFNSKTQVRNILGNAVISPVNAVSDVFSTVADKALAKKTGVRTVGLSNPVQNIKGLKKGLYESYNDFKKGINTREISGDRFEIGQGKAFKGKGLGKALNRVDQLLNFMLDAGDRPFYEATFNNSINNQLILNNTDIVTQDMIDIATNEALSRTWQDNNNYTKFVLSIRNAFNGKFDMGKIHTKGFRYGLGDVLIPFAKTPANLTKAIVDYSPIGLVNSLVEGNNIRKAIGRSDLTAQQQHKFVQDLGKATAGTMLYVIGYALAKAGITSGESDEDKDVANFMKNNLGTTQYSIKIGNKTFTYDWAQPIAAPIAMMANLANKDSQEDNLLEEITSVLDIPMNMILEQSFMQSIQEVLSNNGGVIEGVIQQVLDLPSRAVPTFLKQITDMTDTTQRASYEKGKPIQTAVNQVKAKIPGLSKQLAPVSNTLGNDVKKYGGETNPFLYAFHTFLNPANVNSNQKNKAGSEIYKVYEKTGDKTIFPRQAEYTQIIDGTKITLTSNERYQYQKTSGKYYSNVVNELLKSASYKNLSNENKAEILKEIATDSNEKAKEELAKNKNLEYERQKTDVKIEELVNNGLEYSNAYIYKTQIKDIEGDKDNKGKTISSSSTAKKAKYIMDMDTNNTQKDKLLSLLSDTDTKATVSDLKKLNGNYLTYMQQSGKKDDKGISARDKYMMYIDAGIPVTTLNKYYDEIGDIEGVKGSNGKTVSGSKKKALFNYINSLSLNTTQKKILFTKCNSSYGKNYKSEIHAYINSLNISKTRKEQIWSELYD